MVDRKVCLTGISLFGEVNSVYTQDFKQDRPARTTVALARLLGSARIENTVIARRPMD